MKKWGGYMFFFGLGSIILSFLGMQFVILIWIDFFGPIVGWIIRIGLTLGGAALWIAGKAAEKQQSSGPPAPPPETPPV